MAELKFFKSILEDSYETFTIKPGMTVEDAVREYGDDEAYTSNLVECYDLDTGKTFFAPLTDDSDFGIVAVVNGKDVSKEYVFEENDSAVIIVTPMSGNNPDGTKSWDWGWAVGGLVVGGLLGMGVGGVIWGVTGLAWGAGIGGAVGFLAGGFVGADIYNKKHAPRDVDGTQRPDIGGAANQPITGNPIPLVLGKKEISPFIIGSPYVEYHGVGGKDAWLHVLYCVGYGPLLVSDIKFDCLKVTDNPRKVMRGMLSGAEMDGGDIKTKWNANSPMFEIIQQDTNSNQLYFGSLYPNSKLQENVGATPMFIRDDTLTDDELYDSTTKKLIQYSNSNYDNGFRTNSVRFSQQYTRKLEVAVDIPEGIYFEQNNKDGGTNKASIPLYLAVQWRPYSDAASKRERDGEGDAEFRSESNHGYEYSSSRRDGWITFDEMLVDDGVGKKPVTFTEARRSADVKAHSGNTLHKEEEPGSRDYTDAEVIATLKDYEIREKDENYTVEETYLDHLERVFSPYKAEYNETYKNWLGITKPAKVGFKLEFGKKCPSEYKDRFGFAESDHDYMFTESQFDSIVNIVYGTNASAAKKAFMQIPPENGKRKVTIFCHPYRGSYWSRDYMDNTQDVIHYMQMTYGIYKERKVTRTRTVAYRAHAIDYDINWTRLSPQGPMIIGSITFKNGIKNYNFETKDVYLYLPMTWTSDFAFSKEDYDRIETVYRDGIQYHRLECNNWPIVDTTKPEQDFCNENWVNCKVFNLQEAQNYVSSKSEDEKFNKSEIRVTFTADIEAFCKKYNEVASDFLYGSDNSTKALEIRVIRISPNYINEISTSSNKYPKTFHDGISWKTLTSETIDIDDINKEFSNKIGKELQEIQDQLNGNVQLSNLNVISYAHLREKDWPFDEDLDATIVPLYAQQYTRMIDGVKHRILATPVGDEEILTPAELESYVDDFAESKNDTKGLIVFYKEDNEVYGETSAISTFINDIFYTVDRYYSGETNDGIDKFIPSRPISNRHYKDACLLSLSVMADNTGNIQGQLEKLSLVAQAFAPKLNGSIWFPENIQKKKKYFLGSKVELKDTGDKTAKEQYEEAIANGDTKAICINGGNNWRQKIDSIIFAKPEDFNPYIGNVLYTYDETKNKSVSSSEMHTYAPGKTVSYLGLTALTPHVYIELTGSDNGQKMYAFLDITGTLIGYTTYKVVKVVTVGDIVINEGSTPNKSGWYLTDESYAVGSEEGIDFGKEDYSQTQISQFCYEGYEGEWSNPGKSVEANKIVYKKVYNTTYQTDHVLFIRTDKDIGVNDKLTGTVIEFNPSHENNSAPSQFMLACIGPHLGKDALDYSDINLMSIAEWHSNCIKVIDGSTYPGTTSIAEIFMECNGYVYSKLKLEDLLSKIAVSGRAGYTRGDDGKIIAVMDNIVPYPKGILNNQNALSVTISYSFLPAPSGVLVNFKNADNFGIDEGLMVMNDGEDFRNPTGDVEMQSFDFVTNITQAYSLGRYYLANKEFSRNAINWKAGIEGFDLQYGDVLKVTFDMLLVGQACGRITEIIEKDGKAYGLILSDTYEYDGKPDHAIEVMQTSQYGKDRVIVIPVNNEEVSVEYTDPRDGKTKVFRNPKVGTVNFVSFDEPITLGEEYAVGEKMYFFKPQVENLVNYGFKDKVSRLYRIRSKAPDTNFSFAFNLVPYSERFYDYGCDIPSMNRNITVPSRTSDADISIDNKATITEVLTRMEESKSFAEVAIEEALSEISVDTIPPSPVPRIISSSCDAKGNITILFSKSEDIGSGMSHYIIYRKKVGEDWAQVGTVTSYAGEDNRQFKDYLSEKNINYIYAVTAVDKSFNETEKSAEIAIKSQVTAKPNIPTNVSAIFTKDKIDIAWDANSSSDPCDNPVSFEISVTHGETVKTFKTSIPFITYNFNREEDGYPETSDLNKWEIKVRSVSIYNIKSEYTNTLSRNFSDYKTWKIPSLVCSAKAEKDYIKISWKLSNSNFWGTPIFNVKKGDVTVIEETGANTAEYYFDRDTDGYPEKEDVLRYDFSVVATSEADTKTGTVTNINVSDYKTWKIPEITTVAKARKGAVDISWKLAGDNFWGTVKYTVEKDSSVIDKDIIDNNSTYLISDYPEKDVVLNYKFNVIAESEADKKTIPIQDIDVSQYLSWIPTKPVLNVESTSRSIRLSWVDQPNTYDFSGCKIQVAKAYILVNGNYTAITDENLLSWYEPAIGLSSYDIYDNYKTGTEGGYLTKAGLSAIFDVPLYGQLDNLPINTQYAYRIAATNGIHTSEWSDVKFVIARATSAIDITNNSITTNKLTDGCVTFDKIHADVLSAENMAARKISSSQAVIGKLQGDTENKSNIWDLETGEFRVGNSALLEARKAGSIIGNDEIIRDDTEADYIHYVPGSGFFLKLKRFFMDSAKSVISGLFRVKESEDSELSMLTVNPTKYVDEDTGVPAQTMAVYGSLLIEKTNSVKAIRKLIGISNSVTITEENN